MVPPTRAHVSVGIVLLGTKAEGDEARRIVTPSTPAKRRSLCLVRFLYATASVPVPGKSMPHPDALSLSLLLTPRSGGNASDAKPLALAAPLRAAEAPPKFRAK